MSVAGTRVAFIFFIIIMITRRMRRDEMRQLTRYMQVIVIFFICNFYIICICPAIGCFNYCLDLYLRRHRPNLFVFEATMAIY